jgi:predicted RNase H-like HicB family nuclease
MNAEYTAVVKKSGKWWIGWIEEIPGVNCQEPTHEELIESLRVTLKEALEFNRQDAISANKHSSAPRHSEIDDNRARKICKDLGIKPVK